MDSSLYLVAGAGSTDFGGDDEFTMVFGFGYRVLPTDSLAFHLNVRDHIFESDLLGQDDTYHNIEAILGLTFFF
jgi:outer membrane beta-barrel protein